MKSHVIAFTGVDRIEWVEAELPSLQEGQILVRTEVTVVSPGTELRCLAGEQPNTVDFPFVPGYGAIGVVEDAYSDVSMTLGIRVFVPGGRFKSIDSQWGGHSSHGVTFANGAYAIPERCSSKRAAMARLLAISLRGVHVSKPRVSDQVAVIGLGPIGLLSARLFQRNGCVVLGVDREPARVQLAVKGGLDARLCRNSISETVREKFSGGADIVVDATGSAPILRESMDSAKDLGWGDSEAAGSKLVIQGSYPGEFSLPYQSAFRKELTIVIPRDVTPREISTAIGILSEDECLVEDLITWYGHPKSAAEAYDLLKCDRAQMTAAFDWTG